MFWKQGNREELVRAGLAKLFPRLHRYCLVLTADPSTADDLAQAACLRALERYSQFQQGTDLDKWVFKITQRLWIDEIRKDAVRAGRGLASIDEVQLADRAPNPEANVLNREMLIGVMRLPEAQRTTVLLVYGEGYSYKDAARILDIPIGTVMSRLAAARQKMVATFKDHAKVG